MLRFIKLALGLFLANGFLALVACSGGTSAQMVIDSPAPDFKLSNLEGQICFPEQLSGKARFS